MPVWIEFMEAVKHFRDGEFVYEAKNKATIQYQHISGYEDHFIYIGEHKICVIEDYRQIKDKMDDADLELFQMIREVKYDIVKLLTLTDSH